ncbi:MAG: PIG-L family deacetylase [Candidatus Tectomicrobia bacterium]|nr:PIG-L family deacetylase [Candidatus Tectomicrobia bacterium]
MRVLAIGAHPDDIEFGCAGTLVNLARNGHETFMLVMTKGGSGGDREGRGQEQLASQQILQVSKLFLGDYEDTRVPNSKEVIDSIEAVINEVAPSMIFVNYTEDTHQDHRNLALSTLSAARHIRTVLFYEVPSTLGFTPQVFSDISNVYAIKEAALKAHASQLSKTNVEGLTILDTARGAAHFRGIQGRALLAEAFHVMRAWLAIDRHDSRGGVRLA